MAGRPSQRLRKTVVSHEVHILPIMNVFCVLIPFLMLTATFVQLTIVDTTLPAHSGIPTPTANASPTPTPEEKHLNLTVAITSQGFSVAGYGGVLNVAGEQSDGGKKPTTIIEKNNGSYDFDKLKEVLIRIKEAYPGQYSVILLPEQTVIYDDIIKVMDLARAYKKKKPDGSEVEELLFPNPVLAGRLL